MKRATPHRLRLIAGAALILAALAVMLLRHRDGAQATRAYQLIERDDGMLVMTGSTMGRIPYNILAHRSGLPDADLRRAFDACYDALERVNHVMSAYLPDSDLSRVNRAGAGEAVVVDGELFALLEIARKQSEKTGGAFDPTARRLFQRWKQAGADNRLPTAAQLAETMKAVGWDKVKLNAADRSVTKSVGDLQIDLGAIAKGYAVDRAAAALAEAGVIGAMVEVGGEVRLFGPAPAASRWTVGIQHPFNVTRPDGGLKICGKLRLTDRSVATSGNYWRYATIDGRRYSHIVDARTGRPVDAAPSVTVVADNCMTADAWATSLSILGEAGLAVIEGVEGVEAMMILGDRHAPRVVATSGFDTYVLTPVAFDPADTGD